MYTGVPGSFMPYSTTPVCLLLPYPLGALSVPDLWTHNAASNPNYHVFVSIVYLHCARLLQICPCTEPSSM